MQLNFLDPACFDALGIQGQEQEKQSHEPPKYPPVAVNLTTITTEGLGVQIVRKTTQLKKLYQKIDPIENYLKHNPTLEEMLRHVRNLESEYKDGFKDNSEAFDKGGIPVKVMGELVELRKAIRDALHHAAIYQIKHKLYPPPIDLDKWGNYQEQVKTVKAELAELQAMENKPTAINWAAEAV